MSPSCEWLLTLATEIVSLTLAGLPEQIQIAAKACVIEPVFMRDFPVCEEPIEDDLLGLFQGISLEEGSPETSSQLPRIRLFLDNLWDYAEEDLGVFREEVRVTFLHELGHYLGFDEEQVAQLGLA